MREVLFHIGSLPIYSYGFMLALSFFFGMMLAQRLGRQNGIREEQIGSLSFGIIVSALAGAKLLYIVVDWRTYWEHPGALLNIRGGGFVYYGGFLAAFAWAWYYTRKHKLPAWRTFDALVPAVPLGLGLTRIGCFLSGCCFGAPAEVPWAVTFPIGSPAWDQYGPDHHLHPTQLYASADGFLLFAVLMLLWKRRPFDGWITLIFIGAYAIIRLIEESLRSDQARGFYGPLSTSEWISVLMVGFAVVMWWKLRREKDK